MLQGFIDYKASLIRFAAAHTSVLSQKFIAESGGETADPSTSFVAKNATNCAQDDSAFVERMNDSVHQGNLNEAVAVLVDGLAAGAYIALIPEGSTPMCERCSIPKPSAVR